MTHYYLKHIYDRDLCAVHLLENNKSVQITKNLYLSDKMADTFFVFDTNEGEIRVPAHKLILAGGSDVFAALFYGDLQEKGDIKIIDASIDSFKEFLQFFYLNVLNLTFDNIGEVMYLTHKYLVSECYSVCDEFLKHLPVKDVCFTLELALIYDHGELIEFCEQEIRKYADEVLLSESFEKCSKDVLERILKMDYLDCHEIQVFDACVKWAKEACKKANEDPSIEDNLRKSLGDCFLLIQFGVMTKENIYDCVRSQKNLFTRDELLELFHIVLATAPVELRSFNRKTRKIRCDIECDNPNYGPDPSIHSSESSVSSLASGEWNELKQQEITQFYTNRKVALLAIETNYINVSYNAEDLSAVLYVLVHHNVVLLKQNINFFKNQCPDGIEIYNYTKLRESITIDPHQLYKIQIKFNSLVGYELDECDKETLMLDTLDVPVADVPDRNTAFKVEAKGGIVYTFHFNNV